MAYVSLYRKWRPQTFEEVVGQEYVTRTLANSLRSGNFAHAYLFAGPRGTGKTSTARILAKALNCEEGPTPNPCNRCPSCRGITEGTSVDVVEIDAASNRGIDDIRDLRERVIFTPASARMKVYVLDEAHMLTEQAFNAFLKTLEEPPPHVVFVLATTEPHKMPATILSRCQRYDFRSVPLSRMVEYLRKIAGEEGVEASESALRLIARKARGSVRDALVILEQLISYGNGRFDESAVAAFLGLIEDEALLRMGDCIASGDAAGAIRLVERVYEEGRDLAHFTSQLQEHFRRLFLLQHAEMSPDDLEVDEGAYGELRRQAGAFTPQRATHILAALREVAREMPFASSPRLLLESALLAMTRSDLEVSLQSVSERLQRLEEEIMKWGRKGPVAASRAVSEAGESRKAAAVEAPVVGGDKAEAEEGEAAEAETCAVEEREAEAQAGELDITALRRAWAHIRERVKEKKVTTHAFLLEGKPGEVRGDELVLFFPPDRAFHRGEMEKEAHRQVLEKAILEVTGVRLRVSTRLEDAGREGGKARKKEPLPGIARPTRRSCAETATEGAELGPDGTSGGEGDGLPHRAEAREAQAVPTDLAAEENPVAERAAEEENQEAGRIKLVKDIFGAEMVEERRYKE